MTKLIYHEFLFIVNNPFLLILFVLMILLLTLWGIMLRADTTMKGRTYIPTSTNIIDPLKNR